MHFWSAMGLGVDGLLLHHPWHRRARSISDGSGVLARDWGSLQRAESFSGVVVVAEHRRLGALDRRHQLGERLSDLG